MIYRNWSSIRIAGLLFLSLLILGGCTSLGPDSITAGRMSYSEAISATSDEQLLQIILRDRYKENITPLSVSSITANIRFSSNLGVNIGLGDDRDFEGNLVPISAGVAYEENPTISYIPIDTSSYLHEFISPIPLDTALLLIRSMSNKQLVSLVLLERINNLKNPKYTQSNDDSKNFLNAVRILSDLITLDLVEFVSLGSAQYGLLFQIDEIEQQGFKDLLLELMDLLELGELLNKVAWSGEAPKREIADTASNGIEKNILKDKDRVNNESVVNNPKDSEAGIASAHADAVQRSIRGILVIKLRFSAVADGSSIAITTNSVYDMIRLASNAVDVPQEHIDKGFTTPESFRGLASKLIRVKRSKDKPDNALVASRIHNRWYYIDNTDLQSKDFFRILSTLSSSQMASAGRNTPTPLLTVPISR